MIGGRDGVRTERPGHMRETEKDRGKAETYGTLFSIELAKTSTGCIAHGTGLTEAGSVNDPLVEDDGQVGA